MLKVKLYKDLNEGEIDALKSYLTNKSNFTLPYQTVSFLRLVDDVFDYRNLSLVALSDSGNPCGFIPQWKKGKVVESVPWRDKGGPVYDTKDVLDILRSRSVNLAREVGAKGILWKDFQDPEFNHNAYYINVDIELSKFDQGSYWQGLSSKVRGKVRQARKKNLHFKMSGSPDEIAIHDFYSIFVENRWRLGVPTYPIDLFVGYFKYFSEENIKLCEVLTDEGEVLASLILLHTDRIAIDAYSGSTRKGMIKRANDFMIYNVVSFCIQNRIDLFDFGADSPFQESLILYKCKWLGKRRSLTSSAWGEIREVDPNKKIYGPARSILRNLPYRAYQIASSLLVK